MKVLVAEDNKLLGKNIKKGLEEAGFTVDLCMDGQEALYHLEEAQYDLALLDWMLPMASGIEILKSLRARGCLVPAIMITSKGMLPDRIQGFEAGIDDYLVKPFDMAELIARMRAVFRRGKGMGTDKITIANLSIEVAQLSVKVCNMKVEFTTKEFDLLLLLSINIGKMTTRQTLVDKLYHMNEEPESNSLDVLLARVRKKLQGSGVSISTLRGKGFLLRAE